MRSSRPAAGIKGFVQREERETVRESGPSGLLVGVFWHRVGEPESLEEVVLLVAVFWQKGGASSLVSGEVFHAGLRDFRGRGREIFLRALLS